MRIVVTGASGLVGTALVPYLRKQGHDVFRLVRTREKSRDAIYWDPDKGVLDGGKLDGVDTIIHLAGANIASGRWTKTRKRMILDSRINGLRTLTDAVKSCSQRPGTLISASATGFYGNRGSAVLAEDCESGTGFLAEVCRKWEGGLHEMNALGLRTISLRLGIVLSAKGGVIGKMLPPFKCGLGGRLGSGKQWMSWISETDLLRSIDLVLNTEAIHGPVNIVSPHPVTNSVFTQTLAKVLGRPAVLPIPSFLLRLVFGQMADDALLASTRAKPEILQTRGFCFSHEQLENAVREVLSEA